MTRSLRRWSILLPLLFASPVAAQVRGVVVDAAGAAVPQAAVELWDGNRPVASAVTDDGGRFALPPAAGARLSVRRLGFRPLAMAWSPADSVLALTLEAQLVTLAPLAVAAPVRRPCPNREDPRARALWEAVRRRYNADSVPLLGIMEFRSGVGEREDAFRPEAGRVRAGWVQGMPVVETPWMDRSGYATAAQGGVGERTAFWSYRSLDGGTMQDFVGAYFGTAHVLSFAGSAPEGWVLAFCPRVPVRDTGVMEGTLAIGADSLLRSARWSFRTPRPVEDAGGEASYWPPDPTLGAPLLARETAFWRRTTGGRFYFEARTFSAWMRLEGARQPIPPPG